MNELAIVNQIPAFLENAKTVLNGENISAIATLMGVSGVTIRDLKYIKNFKKLFTKCEEEFPNGFQTEEQESIFNDTFVELSDFIKENKNIDGKVFEKISNILINGIKKKDVLTKEYIKIMMNLSWLDLNVLLNIEIESFSEEEFLYYREIENSDISPKEMFLISVAQKIKYPKEIVLKAFNNLEKNILIYEQAINSSNYTEEPLKYKLITELGEEIKKLIRESEKIAK